MDGDLDEFAAFSETEEEREGGRKRDGLQSPFGDAF